MRTIFCTSKVQRNSICRFSFCVSALEKDELSRLGLYKYIVNVFDKDVATDIDFYTGGFSAYFSTLKSKTDFEPVIIFKIKALRENIFKALDIFKKVICQKYNDYERLKILWKNISRTYTKPMKKVETL